MSWHRDWSPNGPPLPALCHYPAHLEPGHFPPLPNPPLSGPTVLRQPINGPPNRSARNLQPTPPPTDPDADADAQDSMWALLSVLQNDRPAGTNRLQEPPAGTNRLQNKLPMPAAAAAAAADSLAALTDVASHSATVSPPPNPQRTGSLPSNGVMHPAPPLSFPSSAPRSGRLLDLEDLYEMGFLTKVFLRLDPKDLGRAAQACKLLRDQAYLDLLWASLLTRFFYDAPSPISKSAGQFPPREVFRHHASPHRLLHRYVLPQPEDPCPCGTGEQYYKCCLPQVRQAREDSARSTAWPQIKRDASQWNKNHPKVLSLLPPSGAPAELADSDTTTYTYQEGPLNIANDVFVADMTLNDAINYCASPRLQHAVGFTFCADDPAPEGQIRCYFKWATLKGTQLPDNHPAGPWHTFMRTSKVETERQYLEAFRNKQIRLLGAYEMRRASDLTTFLSDSTCPRHSGPFRLTRCPVPSCKVCGGPGQIVDPVHLSLPDPRGRSWCGLCNGSLKSALRPNARCPCVTTRGVKLPLKIITLSQTRSMAGSLADLTSFGELRETLNEIFELHVLPVNRLEPGSLTNDDVDLVLLSTTMGPGLDESELAELQSFVASGGSAILSAFSNHSSEDHWNSQMVAWLGVHNPPRASTSQRMDYNLNPDKVEAALRDSSSAIELLRGPFGVVNRFTNTNETVFELTQPRPVDGPCGGIMLNSCPKVEARAEAPTSANAPHERGTLAYFARADQASDAQQSVAEVPQGLGQVLVVSNYHCLGNQEAWQGGHWYTEPHNRALFLNFAASAVAWRSKDADSVEEPKKEAKQQDALHRGRAVPGPPLGGRAILSRNGGDSGNTATGDAASLLSMSATVGGEGSSVTLAQQQNIQHHQQHLHQPQHLHHVQQPPQLPPHLQQYHHQQYHQQQQQQLQAQQQQLQQLQQFRQQQQQQQQQQQHQLQFQQQLPPPQQLPLQQLPPQQLPLQQLPLQQLLPQQPLLQSPVGFAGGDDDGEVGAV